MGDPATIQAAIAAGGALGGPVLSQLFAPEGQELSSFEGRGRVDPVSLLSQANWLNNAVGRAVTNRAASPISLPSSYVQQPGAYSGGGLPMPIGLVASDPALANPSLLSLPGMEDFAGMFDHLDNQGVPSVTGPGGTDPDQPEPDQPAAFTPNIGQSVGSASANATSGPRRRSGGNLVRAADLIDADDGTADLDQGYGAAQLLLEAIQNGATQRTGALI